MTNSDPIAGPGGRSSAARRASWRRYDQKRAGTPERKAQLREADARFRQRERDARAAWRSARENPEPGYIDGPYECAYDGSTLRYLKAQNVFVCMVCDRAWDPA